MTILNPADATETEKLIFAAAEYKGPVYIRLGREPMPMVFGEDYQPEIGKGFRLREGKAATIIATGIMVERALLAADILGQKGTTVRVVNIHTIKPIDSAEIIKAAWETGAIVTAEEHSVIGGLASAVAEVVVQNRPVPMEFIGVKDRFGQSGTPAQLMEEYGLNPEHIVAAVEKAIDRKDS
jgi:transketolase